MKNEAILRSLIREHVRKVLESQQLDESFKSGILRKLLSTGGNTWRSSSWASAFYNATKVALDKVEDSDFVKMDPLTAYKELKKAGSPKIVFYVSEKGGTNPYAKDSYTAKVNADTLIGVATDQNKWYAYGSSGYGWRRTSANAMTPDGKGGDIGMQKQGSGYGSTGIYNVKRGAEIADVAYVLDLLKIQSKYSTKEKVEIRTKQKSGAVAFMKADEFKKDNQRRYQEILRNRAAGAGQENIVKGVQAAIQTVTSKVSDAIANMTTGKYNNIIVGTSPKGREVSAQDAANFLRQMLDTFERYVGSAAAAEKWKKEYGKEDSWYGDDVKKYALELKNMIQKAANTDYSW